MEDCISKEQISNNSTMQTLRGGSHKVRSRRVPWVEQSNMQSSGRLNPGRRGNRVGEGEQSAPLPARGESADGRTVKWEWEEEKGHEHISIKTFGMGS